MGMTRRSEQTDLDAAVEAVVAGASYRSAAALTGVPPSTVRDYRWFASGSRSDWERHKTHIYRLGTANRPSHSSFDASPPAPPFTARRASHHSVVTSDPM